MVIPVPYASKASTRRVPYVTLVLVALNILAFVLTCIFYSELSVYSLYRSWGSVPAKLYNLEVFNFTWTTLTATFLHVGLFHLAGNMFFLWALGPRVEDDLGHFTYLFFYLLAGISAGLFRFVIMPTTTTPAVGASGAISGVMAAFFMLAPFSRLRTFLPIFGIPVPFFAIPGWLLIGAWVGLNLYYGVPATNQPIPGGTSWLSHLGGIVSGIFLVFVTRLITLPGQIQKARQARRNESEEEDFLDISL